MILEEDQWSWSNYAKIRLDLHLILDQWSRGKPHKINSCKEMWKRNYRREIEEVQLLEKLDTQSAIHKCKNRVMKTLLQKGSIAETENCEKLEGETYSC